MPLATASIDQRAYNGQELHEYYTVTIAMSFSSNIFCLPPEEIVSICLLEAQFANTFI